ncbi:hypothetical protein CU097_007835 [Rhizopus azygosporus]|uniref:Homeobox domain-containing protein n=1 Tax=Rhizopus azygosporus TaxID=86630 RepID=A0A367J8N5_RHIAZ|nr:hypothetical protein CU097_007835 [Rhizopus azygosporus]
MNHFIKQEEEEGYTDFLHDHAPCQEGPLMIPEGEESYLAQSSLQLAHFINQIYDYQYHPSCYDYWLPHNPSLITTICIKPEHMTFPLPESNSTTVTSTATTTPVCCTPDPPKVEEKEAQKKKVNKKKETKKKRVKAYDSQTTAYLQSMFFETYSKQIKLTKQQRLEVQRKTGLPSRNITYWFSNHKRRFQGSLNVFKKVMENSNGAVATYDDFIKWRRNQGLPDNVTKEELQKQ